MVTNRKIDKKIALTGQMRSGKDSAAGYLTVMYDFTPFAFGTELKRSYFDIFGRVTKNKPRAAFQQFGQLMREIDNDVWVNKALREIDTLRPEKVLISDLRQPNEYQRLVDEGYVIIRIKAREVTRVNRMLQAGDEFKVSDLTHDTELHVDDFDVDYEITNEGDKFELYRKLDFVMKELDVKPYGEEIE